MREAMIAAAAAQMLLGVPTAQAQGA